MILPDVNILVHAYDSTFREHRAAKAWWERTLNSGEPVGLPWLSVLGFIRITTSRRIMASPLPVGEAIAIARTWLACPNVRIATPGDRHAETVFGLLEDLGTGGNLTTDADLAALALEYRAEVATVDTDFQRFRGVRRIHPLARRA